MGEITGVILLLIALGLFIMLLTVWNDLRQTKWKRMKEKEYDRIEITAMNKVANMLGLDSEAFFESRELREKYTFREALEEKMIEELLEKRENHPESDKNVRKKTTKKNI